MGVDSEEGAGRRGVRGFFCDGHAMAVNGLLNVGGHVDSGSAIVVECDVHVQEFLVKAMDDGHFFQISA